MLFQTAISMFLVLFGFRVNLLETTLLGNLGQGVKHSIDRQCAPVSAALVKTI